MNQFMNAVAKKSQWFKYLRNKFPGLSETKLKVETFIVRDLCKLKEDPQVEKKVS